MYVFIDARYVGLVKEGYYNLSIVFTIKVVNNMILIAVAISMLCLCCLLYVLLMLAGCS